jgi:hypothetical protein
MGIQLSRGAIPCSKNVKKRRVRRSIGQYVLVYVVFLKLVLWHDAATKK